MPIATLANGWVGTGCVPAQETYTYNNRLQPVMIQVGQYQGNLSAFSCTVYNYYAGSSNASSCAAPSNPSGTNNGNVMGYYYADGFQSSFSHLATYCYDSLNRLSGALTQSLGASTPSNCPPSGSSSIWGLSYGYDRYANLTSATSTAGTPPTLSLGVNTSTNQITNSNFTYDAAGNLTQDGTGTLTHTYQWDGEGHLASVDVGGSAVCGNGATVCYTYNALGQRVQGVYSGSAYPGTFEWLFDPNGEELSECDGGYDSGGRCWYSSWVRLGGRSIADYWPTNLTAFPHPDNLGSSTMTTVWDGTVATDMRYYPFGQIWQSAGRGMWDVHFAGMQYPETNFSPWLMPTDFRKYHPTLGRWLSPDPARFTARVAANPQRWNRYAYVINNPTSLVDVEGLSDISLYVFRQTETKYSTIGTLLVVAPGAILHGVTLELPDRGNKHNVSRIPAGTYEAERHDDPKKPSHILRLKDVPNRSVIDMHTGNYPENTKGCILCGTERGGADEIKGSDKMVMGANGMQATIDSTIEADKKANETTNISVTVFDPIQTVPSPLPELQPPDGTADATKAKNEKP